MDPKTITKTYTNGEITVVWKPGICQHSTICWKNASGLPSVFNPKIKPWINMDGADTEQVRLQVMKCPSGALSYYLNKDSAEVNST